MGSAMSLESKLVSSLCSCARLCTLTVPLSVIVYILNGWHQWIKCWDNHAEKLWFDKIMRCHKTQIHATSLLKSCTYFTGQLTLSSQSHFLRLWIISLCTLHCVLFCFFFQNNYHGLVWTAIGFFKWNSNAYRARNCDSLVANATKNWALATKFSELVASWRLAICTISKDDHNTTCF